ncbi:MAG: DMT family transporter [Reyranellales bacterium]
MAQQDTSRSSPYTALPPLALVLLLLMTLGFGCNWPIMKEALTEVPIWSFRTFCALTGALGLMTLARLARQSLHVQRGQWGPLIAMSLCNVTGWNILMVYALARMPAGRAAILAYTMPLWAILVARWWLGEPLTARRLLGLGLGLGGLAVLMEGEIAALSAAPAGALLMSGGALCWALGTVMMKRWPIGLPTLALTGWQMLIGAVPMLLGALVLDAGRWQLPTLWPALAVLYNIVVVFIFCYWAWFKIVMLVPVAVSSLSTLLIPVVGVLGGAALLGERPGWQDIAALVLVLAALTTVLLPQGAGKPRP